MWGRLQLQWPVIKAGLQMPVSNLLQLARKPGMCCSRAMNTFVISQLVCLAATAAALFVAALGLNNNANNNTRHHGWAGV
jgi:hypothetical protein